MDPNPRPFRKLIAGVLDFADKIEELHWEEQEEMERHKAAVERLRMKRDLILINYYGPNWLTTGKVGGWEGE